MNTEKNNNCPLSNYEKYKETILKNVYKARERKRLIKMKEYDEQVIQTYLKNLIKN